MCTCPTGHEGYAVSFGLRALAGMVLCLAFCWIAGCSDSHVDRLSKPPWRPEEAHWLELDIADLFVARLQELTETPPSLVAESLTNIAADPNLNELFQRLEDTPIPKPFNSPIRLATKSQYVEAWRELQRLGQSTVKSPPEPLLKQTKKVITLSRRLHYIPNQVVPTGKQAEKYGAVEEYKNPYETPL